MSNEGDLLIDETRPNNTGVFKTLLYLSNRGRRRPSNSPPSCRLSHRGLSCCMVTLPMEKHGALGSSSGVS